MKAIVHVQVFDNDEFETFFDIDNRECDKLLEKLAASKTESEKYFIARGLNYYACIKDYMAEDLSEQGEIGQYLCKQLWEENEGPCSGFYEVDVTYHSDIYFDDDINVEFNEKKLDLLVLEGHDENGVHVVGVVTADKVQDVKKTYSTIAPVDKTSRLFADGFENTANATFEDEEIQFVSDSVLKIIAEENQMIEEKKQNEIETEMEK